MMIDELLRLADECYARARGTPDPEAKAKLMNMGDKYAKTAEAMHLSHPGVTIRKFGQK